VLKVVDPAEARKVLGAAATDAEVTEYILKASQLDDAYYNFLKKLMQESGTPPAFRLPARKRISPTIVEVERMDAPTISELRRQKSPLLDRCKTQLDRYIRIMGGVYVAMDLAYRKRYGKSETLRAVFSKGADGERRMLPLGPDMNKPNIKLTAECEIQPIDQ
jgi:hypothetical protein